MRKLVQCSILFMLMIIGSSAYAQAPEMADQMRSDGKIYVVVAIVLVVVIGMIAYLFTIDRKVSRLEQNQTKRL